jgi:hypothetical protein
LINETLNINLIKHDELISLVNGYLIMNELDTFYETTKNGYKNVGKQDLVRKYILLNFIKIILSNIPFKKQNLNLFYKNRNSLIFQ